MQANGLTSWLECNLMNKQAARAEKKQTSIVNILICFISYTELEHYEQEYNINILKDFERLLQISLDRNVHQILNNF